MQKYFDWDEKKNKQLKEERDIGFEDILNAIDDGNLIDVKTHHNQEKYPLQKLLFVNISGYVYIVPFAEDEEKYFLKTIIPSRKATKQYLIHSQ